ncbi:MAG TPA: protoporphyrinogen oxidase [Actinomycetota bacterium]|nr:protoporphyrinogen oxidase [Actinomycetota bacterium]
MHRLIVVGGGVTGLAGARAAVLAARGAGIDLEVVVLEASDRLGGKLFTEVVDGVTIEWGPDAFLAAKSRGRGLAEELGLGGDLVPVAPGGRRAFVLRGGTLHQFPEGLVMGVPTSTRAARRAVRAGLLSWGGAMRAAVEPLLPGRPIGDPDEPAATVVRRRLGRDAAVRLVEPILRGVFGVPGSEVGVRTALPRAVGQRSLARALRPPAGAAADSDGSPFLALRGGFGSLVDTLAGTLPAGSIRTGSSVVSVSASGTDGFEVTRDGAEALSADAVLLTAPAAATASALDPLAPLAAALFREVRSSPSAVIVLRFPEGSLVRTLDGSGFLVDPDEGLATAACSWYSSKWPHLAGGRLVLRAVVTDPGRLGAGDDELVHRVAGELGRVMGAQAEPDLVRIHRWEQALPVFAPGHQDRMRQAVDALPERVAVAGAFLGAVGIPDCIESGETAARSLVETLARAPRD